MYNNNCEDPVFIDEFPSQETLSDIVTNAAPHVSWIELHFTAISLSM